MITTDLDLFATVNYKKPTPKNIQKLSQSFHSQKSNEDYKRKLYSLCISMMKNVKKRRIEQNVWRYERVAWCELTENFLYFSVWIIVKSRFFYQYYSRAFHSASNIKFLKRIFLLFLCIFFSWNFKFLFSEDIHAVSEMGNCRKGNSE